MNEDSLYTPGEVRLLFLEVHKQLDRIEEDGKETKMQAKKTNGRVGKLEGYRTGIMMCMGIITFVVMPLIIYTFRISQENLKGQILNEIKK